MSDRSAPERRFSNRVENYVRYRPGYPEDLVRGIFARAALPGSAVVADVGSGTGLSSIPFLQHGSLVYGVEPNDEMREAAEKLLAPFPNFHSIAGSAEHTTLAGASVDLVVCAQAFHWLDHEKARPEFRRISRGEQWAVIVFNIRSVDATPFLRDYEAMLLDCGVDYSAVRHENVTGEVLTRFFGGDYEELSFPNEQIFDFASVRGRLLSSSYAPAEDEPGFDAMMARLKSIYETHHEQGLVRFEYETKAWLGRLRD